MDDRDTALIAWLALEREAVWFFPYLGARVPGVADDARAAAGAHRNTRDRLLGLVDDTTTVQPAYDIGTVDSVSSASTAARRLEQRIQAACLAVVATSTSGEDRELGVTGLRTAALAELGWSGRARAFPGLAD